MTRGRGVGLNCWCHLSNIARGEIVSYNLGRWDWLAFSEIWSLKHVRGFQNKNFILGSFVVVWYVVFNQECCVFIQYNLPKGCCKWTAIQPWTQAIDYSLPGLTWQTRLRIGISHLPVSEKVVYGRCYISHYFYFSVIFYFSAIFYDCLLVGLCFLFLFSCLSTVVWATKNPH